MEKKVKMQEGKIIDVIKVVLGNILLELYFNIECENKKFSFKMSISDDGETVLFSRNSRWIALNDINYDAYSVIQVNNDNDELAKLLENKILNVQFGVGKTLETDKNAIYYVKINTNKNEFLFFNNGDEGAYSFDKIKDILTNDTYGFKWSENLPFDSSL